MCERWFSRIGILFVASCFAVVAPGQTSESIVIDGSTGVLSLAIALGKAFQEGNLGLTLQFGQGLGTKARLEALAAGKIDIALASHGLNVSDIARQGLTAHEIARTAVVIGVNATVSVSNLTDAQICDVYAGKISNWKLLGGPDMEVAPRTRPETEVDAEVLRASIMCMKELRMPEAVKVMPRSGDMAKELAVTTGAIGVTTMTVVEQSQGKIRPISVNGILPSPENVERGTYALVRESFFVTKSSPSPRVARFLEFVQGPVGAGVIRANGAIPKT